MKSSLFGIEEFTVIVLGKGVILPNTTEAEFSAQALIIPTANPSMLTSPAELTEIPNPENLHSLAFEEQ
jgi:hypothetical protein